jgi:hypothetical protein
MTLKQRLSALVSAIIEETQKNKSFRENVEHALGINTSTGASQPWPVGKTRQKKGRRTPALHDPVELARQGGEGELRAKISELTLDQLRDIVAQYGMDPGKLVMKWKDINRVIDRIVEVSLARSTKGDAFRND